MLLMLHGETRMAKVKQIFLAKSSREGVQKYRPVLTDLSL